MSIKAWIQAARLRTLPLALAGTVTGNLLAYAENGSFHFNPSIFILSILTAVFLQVLSNYANDYGDFKNGADSKERTDRVMASGLITEKQMKRAIVILITLCLISGISLLVTAIEDFDTSFFLLLGMGITGLFAAYYYTAGSNPYGYIGFGDISVFIFFGLLSVAGSYFLQTQTLESHMWWLASAIGLMSVGVLNVNNIRDITTDESKNKMTIPVRIGYRYAVVYQVILLCSAVVCYAVYSKFQQKNMYLTMVFFLMFLTMVFLHLKFLKKAIKREDFNQQLKFLSLSTFILSLFFCFLQMIEHI